MDRLQHRFHWTQLQTLLSTDPVLTILEPELIGRIRGPAIAPQAVTIKMGAVQSLIELLQGAGFVLGAFDVQVLLECDLDQVMTVSRSLFKAMVPLTSNYDLADLDSRPPPMSK